MQPLYTRCLRCGRSLRDHKSKSRGYGPTCWKKVLPTLPSCPPTTEIRSIENIFAVNSVYDSLRVRVSSHSCPSCGALLSSAEVHSYDHEDGLNLRGFLRPQWIYITCTRCGADIALHKLTRDGCGDLCKHHRQISLVEALRV
ncbi:hypothetical protein MSHOH_2626 [Methanosarcina horonobensis HB-1 = JCM 15518]|uniref:Uncharacterized protein n=1 Tax=Methanosarcina horonobensis HB-1 = JCM 15518 TaxID=1434110 RepID=A0A0E3SBC3_9EURY|nr:DUF6011 domain-containing protein [Methanosarcina horonobensis]AKB79109.1 hypothetical protein MSHOH_2626 [Methanosarcina horonobensis HB-1 = JCM 15518]